MVKSIFQYLLVLHSPNLHQLFILIWSTVTTGWFVSLTYFWRLSDHGWKKWLSPYFSTYWCYIHQTCTNCSSWHDLLIPRVGLCPWPTFHASVTKTKNGYSRAPVMVPITIMSSVSLSHFAFCWPYMCSAEHWSWFNRVQSSLESMELVNFEIAYFFILDK